MGIIIPEMVVMTTFLMMAILLSCWTLDASRDQSVSILDVVNLRESQLVPPISIVGAQGADPVTILVDNVGDTLIADAAKMDVFIRYVPDGGVDPVVKRLDHVAGNPGNDQWTVTSLSPDNMNPGIWDPSERATLTLQPAPVVEEDTSVTVVVSTPQGFGDSTTYVASG